MSPKPETPSPQTEVLNMLVAPWITGAISAVARFGIPDLVEGGAKSAGELAAHLGVQPGPLYRLLRATASAGVLAEGAGGKFSQTPLSATLRRDANPSLRGFALFVNEEWHARCWSHIEHSIRTGRQTPEQVCGKPIFEYLQENRELGAIFNGAMTSLSMIESPAVVEAYDFNGIDSIVDVAGGHGLLLATILKKNPQMKGTLYEAPQVLEGAKSGPLKPVIERVKFESGDMFSTVPAGADAYIMKYIIHDWPDDLCVKILSACRRGIHPGGKLLVVDNVVHPGNDFEFAKIIDIEMLLFPGGLERTEQQFRDLFAASGWRLARVIPTSCHISIVEGVPS